MCPNDANGKNPIGIVISTLESPTTDSFSFVLTTETVRRGQFVQTETDDGLLIGFITDITRANRYFERAESVAEYERLGAMSQFPTMEWEYTVADVKALGVYTLLSDGRAIFARAKFPASPGAKVYSVDESILKDFIGLDERGLNIGKLENHNVEVRLSMSRLLQKHLAILAMSGAGKSHLASVIIEELLERRKEHGRLAIIVIDVHGEYGGFRQGQYAKSTTVIDGKEIKIALSKLSPSSLFDFMPNISGTAMRDLSSILSEMKKEAKDSGNFFGLPDLIERIKMSDMKESTKGALLSWLDALKSLRLIGKAEHPSLQELAKPGHLTILDLSDIDNMKKKQLIVAHIAKKLFKARKKEKVPPFLLLIEESHNFAPEKVAKEHGISKGIIETIAREGRKFGASLCLVSQRPVKLSTTALSQCNTAIILRVTNPYDLKHIGESCEGIDQRMQAAITTLYVGEALIVGEATNHPIFVRVRDRKSKKSSKGQPLEEIAKRWEEAEDKKKDDVEAFL